MLSVNPDDLRSTTAADALASLAGAPRVTDGQRRVPAITVRSAAPGAAIPVSSISVIVDFVDVRVPMTRVRSSSRNSVINGASSWALSQSRP
jgi:hypothetical protein